MREQAQGKHEVHPGPRRQHPQPPLHRPQNSCVARDRFATLDSAAAPQGIPAPATKKGEKDRPDHHHREDHHLYQFENIDGPVGITTGPDGALWFTNDRSIGADHHHREDDHRTTESPGSTNRRASRPGRGRRRGSPTPAATESGGSPPPSPRGSADLPNVRPGQDHSGHHRPGRFRRQQRRTFPIHSGVPQHPVRPASAVTATCPDPGRTRSRRPGGPRLSPSTSQKLTSAPRQVAPVCPAAG